MHQFEFCKIMHVQPISNFNRATRRQSSVKFETLNLHNTPFFDKITSHFIFTPSTHVEFKIHWNQDFSQSKNQTKTQNSTQEHKNVNKYKLLELLLDHLLTKLIWETQSLDLSTLHTVNGNQVRWWPRSNHQYCDINGKFGLLVFKLFGLVFRILNVYLAFWFLLFGFPVWAFRPCLSSLTHFMPWFKVMFAHH